MSATEKRREDRYTAMMKRQAAVKAKRRQAQRIAMERFKRGM